MIDHPNLFPSPAARKPPTSALPPVRVAYPHVIVDPGVEDGSPTIEGSRVPVRRLFAWHRQGTTVETLVRRFPGLGVAKILTALAFAYDNLALVTADLIREREGRGAP